MAKSFIDVLQDSPRTGLGIPIWTKKPLSRTNTPPFGFKLRVNQGRNKKILPRLTWTTKSAHDAGPRVQAPMRFLLAIVVAALCTPIELPRLNHQGDKWLDKHPYLFRLEHERDHRVRSELCAHCPTDSHPFRAPPGTDKEYVLCIFQKGPTVATRLIVSFLEAVQVRIKATIARKRQVASSGIRRCVHLPDWSLCHLVCHFLTSLPLLSLRMAFFARAISCSLVKQVTSLRSWKVSSLSSAEKFIGETLARTSTALVDTVRYAETILSTTPRCIENSFFWVALFVKALVETGTVLSSFEFTMLATSLLLDSLGPPILGMSRVKAAPHWMALAVVISGAHDKSLLWETTCRPRIASTYRSDSHLSFATGSLETFSTPSPRCSCSASWY